jgi:hypothetical protein
MTDTVEQPVLVTGERQATIAALARISVSLDLLASVLASFPAKNAALWHASDMDKQLQDLNLACEHLRAHARQLEDLAQGLKS